LDFLLKSVKEYNDVTFVLYKEYTVYVAIMVCSKFEDAITNELYKLLVSTLLCFYVLNDICYLTLHCNVQGLIEIYKIVLIV